MKNDSVERWIKRGLSTRAARALVNLGCHTVEDILALGDGSTWTWEEVLALYPNVGTVTVAEIKSYISRRLSLRPEIQEIIDLLYEAADQLDCEPAELVRAIGSLLTAKAAA